MIFLQRNGYKVKYFRQKVEEYKTELDLVLYLQLLTASEAEAEELLRKELDNHFDSDIDYVLACLPKNRQINKTNTITLITSLN